MPDIVESISESQNVVIEMPAPTWLDAVGQYIKNLTQMSSFILIIIYMGIISKEKESGTIIFLLVKPVVRSNFIFAKYSAVTIAALFAMLVSFLATSFYISLFFENFDFASFALINLMMFVYVLSVLYITVFFSSIFKSQILAGVCSFVMYLLFNLLAQVESFSKFVPGGIVNQTTNVVNKSDIDITVFFSSLIILVFCVTISSIIFKRWEP
jgi:ABC-2 type transport system permease protein